MLGRESVIAWHCHADWPRPCPRQDSNLRTALRRRVLYPLSYGGSQGTIRRAS